MKTLKHVIQLIALLTLMTSFIACQEDPDAPAPPSLEEISKEAGVVHNAAMAYVRDYLEAELAKVDPSTMTKDKFKSLAKEGCIGFLNENDYFEGNRSEALDIFKGIWEDYGSATASAGTAMTPIEEYLKNSTVLNSSQQTYALDVLLIINNSTVPSGCYQQLDSLFDLTQARLGETDGIPVMMGCGIGGASYDYWFNNLDDWEVIGTLIGGRGSLPSGTSTRNDVGKADAGGAVGGAAASVVTGCAELTAGVCAGVGAAAGGIASSIGKIVEVMWDHYF